MKIHGLAKLTLLDYPGHVACTVFLASCDFRCPYCHNFELAEGNAEPVMEDEELLAFLKKRIGLLDGVAITGGEPCLHVGLPDLIKKIRQLGFAIKLDTNGTHPKMLRNLTCQGLVDYVAMDIKNSPAKYAQTAGLCTKPDQSPDDSFPLSAIYESITILMKSGVDYEFRTTVVKEYHEASDFEEIGKMIKGAKNYYLQCFTDRDNVPRKGLTPPTKEDMKIYLDVVSAYVKNASIRGME